MTVRGTIAAGCLITMSFGCAWSEALTGPSEVRFSRSLIVPAADGMAEVRRDENGNAQIDIKVDHLAPPERIAPGATSYVVWVKPMRGDMKFQNLGALRVDPNLSGELRAITSLRHFQLIITPEAAVMVQVPSGPVVLEAEISR
jgi:hypothetical protein